MGFNRFYVLIVTTDYHNNIRKLAVVIYNFLQLIYLVTLSARLSAATLVSSHRLKTCRLRIRLIVYSKLMNVCMCRVFFFFGTSEKS